MKEKRMKWKIAILVWMLVFGLSGSIWIDQQWTDPQKELWVLQAEPEQTEQETWSWWTLLYERPNPERLPVKVSFWFAKNT